jgi:uncharacterized protein (TIGR02444 family)
VKKEALLSIIIEEDFLSFITDLCAKPDIKEACWYLQEKYALNVNILFFCCWVARQQYQLLEFDDLQTIINRTMVWNIKVVNALNELIGLIGRCHDDEKISEISHLAIESRLLAERAERSLILQLVNSLETLNHFDKSVVGRALTNVFNYIRYHQVTLHQNDLEKVYRIIKRFEEIS